MRKILQIQVLLIFTMSLFSACSDDHNNNEVKEYTLTVASVKMFSYVDEILVDKPNRADTRLTLLPPVYFVKNEGENEWGESRDIVGFTHEEGYEYVIKVKEHTVILMDIPVTEKSLIEVVSKIKKDSENIPLQNKRLYLGSVLTGDEHCPYYYRISPLHDKWQKFPLIDGFDYEEGFEYELTIGCKYNGVDASPKYSFIFKELNKKEEKDSKGLPE